MIAATSCMNMIVSADSAPVHLSSALQIPVVSLFENRPEKYLRWPPLNVENILLKEGKIVNDIDVIKIRDAVNFLLKKCYG
ncbi:Glycosyl transferase family 9 (fragment) [Xenorhabdus szentirmaii DSM 16338]|uniref:Glycosyl transferase family 9 n=2 Tax=Xenorhabdus szentirmaii TaxID=290112 RepID=W1J647_9GAMM